MTEDRERQWAAQRSEMVRTQVEERGIVDRRILQAMRDIPRHLFVPEENVEQSYEDKPLAIGEGQTISQPFMVAVMLDHAALDPGYRVLEIGTGSGYQTALLSKLVGEVFTVEINPALCELAKTRIKHLQLSNVQFLCGDGADGWVDHAPFDAIIVSAAAPTVPRDLVGQLRVGARLVMPLGEEEQELIILRKTADSVEISEEGGVRFVPMKGKIEA